MKEVGAVVVAYGEEEELKRCLASLKDAGVEKIVVVDNGAPDGVSDALSALKGFEVEIVVPLVNDGYGGGVNIGAGRLSTEYLLFLNQDVIVEKDCVAELLRALSENGAAAIAGPALLKEDGSLYPSARRLPGIVDAATHAIFSLFGLKTGATERYYNYEVLFAGRTTGVDWVSGAIALVKKSAFEEVGGFDPAFKMYLEDVDLCWRLKKKGYEVLYVPSARAHHLGAEHKVRPYKRILMHHLSAVRFQTRRAPITAPFAGALLLLRMIASVLLEFFRQVGSKWREGT